MPLPRWCLLCGILAPVLNKVSASSFFVVESSCFDSDADVCRLQRPLHRLRLSCVHKLGERLRRRHSQPRALAEMRLARGGEAETRGLLLRPFHVSFRVNPEELWRDGEELW